MNELSTEYVDKEWIQSMSNSLCMELQHWPVISFQDFNVKIWFLVIDLY